MMEKIIEEVDFTLEPVSQQAVWDGVIQADSMWAYADKDSYKNALRNVLRDSEGAKQRALELKELVNEKFSDENLFKGFVDSIYGEQIDLDGWLSELEGDLVEQE